MITQPLSQALAVHGFKPTGPSRPSRPAAGRSRAGRATAPRGFPFKTLVPGLLVVAVIVGGIYLLVKPAPGSHPESAVEQFLKLRNAGDWPGFLNALTFESQAGIRQYGDPNRLLAQYIEWLVPKGEYKVQSVTETGEKTAQATVSITRPGAAPTNLTFNLSFQDDPYKPGIKQWRIDLTKELEIVAARIQQYIAGQGGAH